jgi:hypothetical protein
MTKIVEKRGGEDEKKGRGLTPVKVGVVTKQIIQLRIKAHRVRVEKMTPIGMMVLETFLFGLSLVIR